MSWDDWIEMKPDMPLLEILEAIRRRIEPLSFEEQHAFRKLKESVEMYCP